MAAFLPTAGDDIARANDSAAETAAVVAALRIGRWIVDPPLDEMTLEGRRVKLEPRTMRLLLALARHPGEVLASEVLIEQVWRGLVVTDASLYQAIAELRATLRADAATPAFILNVPRKGYRLVAPVVPLEPSQDAAAAAAGAGLPRRYRSEADAVASVAQLGPRSVAVLPFRGFGLPESHAFVCESLLGELVIALSRQPGLTTISRGTMLSFMGCTETPQRIAGLLGVRYVVEGSLACVGDELRVDCELIDASTGVVTAGESMGVALDRWPTIGQLVVGRLARGLQLELAESAARNVTIGDEATACAQRFATRAWVELYCRPQTHLTNDRAWAWAREALQLDPAQGAAWNALAFCEWRAAQYGWHTRPRATLLADALKHAQRAIDLVPRDPDAHYTLALVTYLSGEPARAEATLRHCLALGPSYAPAHGLLGLVCAARGRPEDTAGHCACALAMSPREPLRAIWHWALACSASMLGDERQALDHATRGIAANPDYPTPYLAAAVAAWRLGDAALARRHVAVLRGSPSFPTIAQVLDHLPVVRVQPWGHAFVEDLRSAGLPSGTSEAHVACICSPPTV